MWDFVTFEHCWGDDYLAHEIVAGAMEFVYCYESLL